MFSDYDNIDLIYLLNIFNRYKKLRDEIEKCSCFIQKKKKFDGFYEDVKNSYYFFMKPTKYGVFIFIF